MRDVSNSENILNSRAIIARIEALRGDLRLDEIEDAREAVIDAKAEADALDPAHEDYASAMDAVRESEAELAEILAASEGETHEDERAELATLEAMAKEGGDYAPDWSHGASLIRESYFTEYAEELAADIGAINPNASWPLNCIDWGKAADELKADYTEIDFDGVTYFIR